MSQFPQSNVPQQPLPPGSAPYAGGPKRTNGWAITSLILGIVQCIPFLSGILAIVFGAIGIKKARDPNVGGKGMAIAGLVLGIVGILLWTLFGGGIFALFKATQPAADYASAFVSDLASGNVDAAMSKCDPTMPRESVEQAVAAVKTWGALKDVTIPARNMSTSGGVTVWTLDGVATFDSGAKTYHCVLHSSGESFKVVEFNLQ